jgi:leader peptidase (prepilin peptidase)/N-methyltransferase
MEVVDFGWLVFYIFVFIFGSLVGSFLNVVILRYHTGQSVFRARSHCFSCGKTLSWRELIPIFSFLIQKGRCRKCGSKISVQYPVVELVTGLVFAAALIKISNFQFLTFDQFSGFLLFKLLFYWAVFSLLVVIAVYDIRHQIIPDLFVWLFNALALFMVSGIFDFGNKNPLGRLAIGAALFFFFALLWLISRGRWMGFGDAKLALGLGWFSGFPGAVWGFLFSFWLGALFSVFLLILKKGKITMKSEIPFAPFLVLGFLIAFFIEPNFLKIFSYGAF